MIWIFDGYFVSQYCSGLFTMQEPSHKGKITLYQFGAKLILIRDLIGVFKRFSHLEISTKYQ